MSLKIKLLGAGRHICHCSQVLISLNMKETVFKEATLKEAVEWCQLNGHRGWEAVSSCPFSGIRDFCVINKCLY